MGSTVSRRVGLLATGSGWHVGDIARAAKGMRLELEPIGATELAAWVGAPAPGRFPERILVRSMPSGTLEQVIFRMDVLQRLEAAGVRVVNRARALEAAIDKYLCAARMEGDGLPVPPTYVCEKASLALDAYEKLGGDVVVKPLFGSEGRGLARIQSAARAAEAFDELERRGAVICLQRFVDHPGYDIRIFTLGGEVLCGMRRVARDGWITNVAQGGKGERIAVSAELVSLALRASASIGAEVAGVDILPDREGRHWLLEVNAVPGWRALASVCEVDVAARVLEYVARE